MVGRQVLVLVTGVRIPVPEPLFYAIIEILNLNICQKEERPLAGRKNPALKKPQKDWQLKKRCWQLKSLKGGNKS